jgi:intraflagellar transport protein 172
MSSTGKITQQFDYSKDLDEKEFTVAANSPSGHSLVLGSFNRLRVFNWAPRKMVWEEGTPKNIPNLYTITALNWKKDGSRLICVSFIGFVGMQIRCFTRSLILNEGFTSNSPIMMK